MGVASKPTDVPPPSSQLAVLNVSANDNLVVSHPRFRSLAIFSLPALLTLNDEPVTAAERTASEQEWCKLQQVPLGFSLLAASPHDLLWV